jgi:hypothetical protein
MEDKDLSQLFFGSVKFDEVLEKKKFIDSMNYLKSLSVEEFTFYKKWAEINQVYNDTCFISNSDAIKARIWTPTDINDESLTIKETENLKPVVKIVDSLDEETWLQVRIFCHSAEYEQTPGRYFKILIINETDGKILGFAAIASDIPSMKPRDEYIGWNKDIRMKGNGEGKILHSAVGTTIAPTQPLGFNFLGGKLIAALITSKVIRDCWKKKYNNLLVGMTTTSLYGPFSMYNNHKWWHRCGVSSGKVTIKPDEKFYKTWHDWLKENKSEKYNKMMTQKEGVSGPVTSAKMRVLNMIYDVVGIKASDYNHGFERGIYYSSFYENTREFLCGKIEEKDLKMKSLIEGDLESILTWWKLKAIDRYKKLKIDGRLNPEKLFYNGIYGMPYEKAKLKYFKDVGR